MDASTSSFSPRMRSRNPNFSDSRHRNPSNRQNFNGRNHHSHRSYSRTMVAKFPSRNLVMGEVKILKRGESLAKIDNPCVSKETRKKKQQHPKAVRMEKDSDLILGSTNRLGPDPKTVQKQITVGVSGIYAGADFAATSPPPSSVPVPGFLGKNWNGTATSDLRRLLRLNMV